MISHKIELDIVDQQIYSLIQADPFINHTEIAKIVNRSQPTVGIRVRKLVERGVLTYQVGVDIEMLDISVGKVGIQTSSPDEILKEIYECPYIINGYRLSGMDNFILILISPDLKGFDRIINHHFRNKKSVLSCSFEVVSELLKKPNFLLDFESRECICMKNYMVNNENIS